MVRELHQALRAGDMERAHGHIAYGFRLEEVLGEVWETGTNEDRLGMITLVRGMFERTSKRLWKEHVGKGELQLKREGQDKEPVWIEARLKGTFEDEGAFRWRYRLHRLNGLWSITQREAVILGVPTDTAAFFRIATRRMGAKLGHAPDLGELVEGLPQWEGRIRKRVMKVPSTGRQKVRRRAVESGGPVVEGATP